MISHVKVGKMPYEEAVKLMETSNWEDNLGICEILAGRGLMDLDGIPESILDGAFESLAFSIKSSGFSKILAFDLLTVSERLEEINLFQGWKETRKEKLKEYQEYAWVCQAAISRGITAFEKFLD